MSRVLSNIARIDVDPVVGNLRFNGAGSIQVPMGTLNDDRRYIRRSTDSLLFPSSVGSRSSDILTVSDPVNTDWYIPDQQIFIYSLSNPTVWASGVIVSYEPPQLEIQFTFWVSDNNYHNDWAVGSSVNFGAIRYNLSTASLDLLVPSGQDETTELRTSDNNPARYLKMSADNAGTFVRRSGDTVLGSLVINGDLTVLGTTTNISTTNVDVEDNTILLNYGEAGAGVTAGTSGIEVERGSLANTSWVFNEASDAWGPMGVTALANIEEIKSPSSLVLNSTSGLVLPSGNTGQRSMAPATGELRWNVSNTNSEIYTGSAWENILTLPSLDNAKDIIGNWARATNANSSNLSFYEQTTNGTNKLTLGVATALSADRTVTLPDADIAVSSLAATLLNQTTAVGMQTTIGVREVLTATRTYYVRADGSNTNTGLSNTSGGAFLTIQKAINTVCSLDCSIYDVTIIVGDGTYVGNLTLKSFVGSGRITIVGNTTTPTNVVVSGNVSGINCGRWLLDGFQINSGSGWGLVISGGGSYVEFQRLDFPTITGAHHISISDGAMVLQAGNYTISGSSAYDHISVFSNANFQAYNKTVTITGSPTFGLFISAGAGGVVNSGGMTYTGTVTGPRYGVSLNGVIQTNGGGASYFPGDTVGGTSSGGQYA